ncbi:aromatic-ring hydroxylase C-terminal domain-containing protein [Pseudonocardia asaccharolytica]|uniref:aromatic-ring hydroxylase C-terminal domain-containing protein n=1 Tax=Pseudonocardia asaccharolytica TaxID=54010 RepID=UPI0004266D80
MHVVTAKPAEPSSFTGLLIRPDGYVAWADQDAGADGLADALSSITRKPVGVAT